MEHLNKKELIDVMQRFSGKTKKELEENIDIFMSVVKQELSKGNKINLRGFGSFEIVERAERIGRNPKTGESAIITARKLPKFKPGDDFKKCVND